MLKMVLKDWRANWKEGVKRGTKRIGALGAMLGPLLVFFTTRRAASGDKGLAKPPP